MTTRRILLSLGVLLFFSGLTIAQVLYGNLVGDVTDPQQGSVSIATVTIKNRDTGFSTEVKTDSRGSYDIGNIPPGTYDITIAAPGFSTYEARQIAIQANNIVRID